MAVTAWGRWLVVVLVCLLVVTSLPALAEDGADGFDHTYSYDQVGNITHNGTSPVTYANRWRATGAGPMSYTYDAAGRVVTRTETGQPAQTIAWDPLGRVESVTQSGTATEFLYDADGGRVARRVAGVVTVQAGPFEWSAADGLTKYYTHPTTGELLAYRTSAGLHWVFSDHLGSLAAQRDPSGTVTHQRYHPYGTQRTAGGVDVELGFTGQRLDPTGLMNYGARLYDPQLGRFISPDTVVPDPGSPQLLNRYSYVANNPSNHTDPSGHFLHIVVGGAVGALVGAGISVVTQLVTTGEVNTAEVLGAAANGAITGAVGAATGGASLVVAATANMAASVVGGQVERAINGQEVGNLRDIAMDAALGGIGGRGGRGAGGRGGGVDAPRGRPASSACSLNSFTPGTLVLMADGSTKPIEDIRVGDLVVATDPEAGITVPAPVIALIEGEGLKDLVDITIDGATITATTGHPFWVDDQGTWVDAGDLQAGDLLVSVDGTTTAIDTIESYQATQVVHNLTIDRVHTYYITAGNNPVLTHNCGEDLDDFVHMSDMMRQASRGKGNFSIGEATAAQADELGYGWVGPNFRVSRNGKAIVSEDGLRQYRPPSYKDKRGVVEANLESRSLTADRWTNNAHIRIV